MRLNSEKKIMLCQKSLYVKQLEYYGKLCEIYSNLAKTQGPNVTPEQLQSRYGFDLTSAASGDLSFLSDQSPRFYEYGSNYKQPRYSQKEQQLFEEYAFASERLRQFKKASEILAPAVTFEDDNSTTIDKDVVKYYHKYMQSTSKSTQIFDQTIGEHTETFLGNEYFRRSRATVKKIEAIDSAHLNGPRIDRTLTPSSFGASINGYKTRLEIIQEAKRMDSREEIQDYKQPANLAKEVAYVAAVRAGRGIQKFHTKHRSQIRATMLACLLAASVAIGANQISDAHEYNNLNVFTSAEQGYDVHISQGTMDRLQFIEQAIADAKNSPTTPTYEELSAIREDLDNVIDDVMTDLVAEAFQDKHPEYTVTNVETRYDKTVNQGKSANSEPEKENTCTITYLDEEGKEQNVYVQDFYATSLMNNAITNSFTNEYTLDHSYPNQTPNQEQNFVQNNQDVYEMLDGFQKILDDTKQLAGTKFIFKDGNFIVDPSIKSVTPEQHEAHSIEDDDDGR